MKKTIQVFFLVFSVVMVGCSHIGQSAPTKNPPPPHRDNTRTSLLTRAAGVTPTNALQSAGQTPTVNPGGQEIVQQAPDVLQAQLDALKQQVEKLKGQVGKIGKQTRENSRHIHQLRRALHDLALQVMASKEKLVPIYIGPFKNGSDNALVKKDFKASVLVVAKLLQNGETIDGKKLTVTLKKGEGFADPRGDGGKNKIISQSRIDKAFAILNDAGIDISGIEAIGRGEIRTLGINKDNRGIIFWVLKEE